MIKIKIPVYMINKNDNVEEKETCAIFEVKYEDKLLKIIDELKEIIPNTVSDWVNNENKIKSNIIFVHNDKIINKSKLNETIFNEDDTLEVLIQFAGG